MKKNSTISLIIVLIIVVVIAWIYYARSVNKGVVESNGSPSISNSQGGSTGNITPELFAGSPLAQNAYLISIPTASYDSSTKKALSGFTVTQTALPDGSMQITLNAQNPEYKTQTYTVKTGEKLYFIERNLSDDNGKTDTNLTDDQAIIVDVNGYIVNQ